MIDIVKASAGSGKTFLLAKTYISLLFRSESRDAYKHILAVTFTNKATDEMKSRILKELDILARTPLKSGYYKEFSKEFGTTEQISRKAEDILFDILHDYGAFSVSTIDKFFQMTLKSFAREVGQFSTYQIELDKDSLVKESIDRMLDQLTEDEKTLLDWLTESAMAQLEEGKKANVAEGLYGIARALKSDAHRELVEASGIDEKVAYSRENLMAVRSACRKCKKDFAQKVKDAAAMVIEVFDSVGVPLSDTYNKFAVKLYEYRDADMKDISAPTDAFVRNASDSEKWFSKAKAKTQLPKLQGMLEGPFQAFLDVFGQDFKVYLTASILEKQLYSLGIAAEFNKSFEDLMKEKNVLNIDDSNTLLRRIIGGTDAPFIYEKLGVWYEHFLLDEFQDTSTIQWENFRPLIAESSGSGNDNLIVGDVKQSIYRWRGSDWHLLDSRIKSEFPSADDSHPLRDNWRSSCNVVRFNNAFFEYAAGRLDGLMGAGSEVGRIYGDVAQEVKKGKDNEGMLDFTFCHGADQLDVVIDSIRNIHDNGNADYGQIAVLVRTHDDGGLIAARLIKEGIPVISDDSLKVKSSMVVRRLASLMHYTEDPQDVVNGFLAKELGITCPTSYRSIPDLAEELLRSLIAHDGEAVEREVLYVQSFMDAIQDWVASNGSDLSGFLKSWDGCDPVIASPQDPKAVRVVTVHKSKGLEFPYVIFPFAESVELSRPESHWCDPDLTGTPLETGVRSAYHVKLSGSSENTLFEKDFIRDRNLQVIDNVNTLYVALTRAGKGLHVIAAAPSGNDVKHMSDLIREYLDMNRDSYQVISTTDEEGNLLSESFHMGDIPDFSDGEKEVSHVTDRPATYHSYALNKESDDSQADVRERGRLKFSADSLDFFTGETSKRKEGTVLHDILSDVVVPSDLEGAVASRLRHGDITQEEAVRYKALLEERIASVGAKGWFPEDRTMVENETGLIAADGTVHRPDRVVDDGNTVTIIDYKFGEENDRYLRQIARYAKLYEGLGYRNVKACLWYVYENKIVYL